MKIGILGNGTLAVQLGSAWSDAGHEVALAGRDTRRVASAVQEVGGRTTSMHAVELARWADVVVVAIAWSGVASAVSLAGGRDRALAGKTIIDCTNPIDFTSGRVSTDDSAAAVVAGAGVGSHVVKALHLFSGATWPFTGPRDEAPVVALCGDEPAALAQVTGLVADLGGRGAVVGGLDAARQAEEVAGFVMRLVGAGVNPRFAVPDVRTRTDRSPDPIR